MSYAFPNVNGHAVEVANGYVISSYTLWHLSILGLKFKACLGDVSYDIDLTGYPWKFRLQQQNR